MRKLLPNYQDTLKWVSFGVDGGYLAQARFFSTIDPLTISVDISLFTPNEDEESLKSAIDAIVKIVTKKNPDLELAQVGEFKRIFIIFAGEIQFKEKVTSE